MTREGTFEELLTDWTPTAEENRRESADGWSLSEDMFRLHLGAIKSVSRKAAATPSPTDQALILVGTHGLNVFSALVGLVFRGQFDVAAHLIRPMFDLPFLILGVGSDEEIASRFMEGDELHASDVRRQVIRVLEEANENELAGSVDNILRRNAQAANTLSHVNLVHGDKLVQLKGEAVQPIVGGRVDRGELRRMLSAVLLSEQLALQYVPIARPPATDEDWRTNLDAAVDQFRRFATPEGDRTP